MKLITAQTASSSWDMQLKMINDFETDSTSAASTKQYIYLLKKCICKAWKLKELTRFLS